MLKISALLNKYKAISEPVKASLWYTVCNVLNKGIALLSTPIFTRLLTEEQYGTFSIFYSWYNIIYIFTSLNIFMGAFNKGLVSNENDRDRLASSFLGLTTTITLSCAAIYLLFPSFFNSIFELTTPLMIAMFVELLTAPALELWATRERFDYKYKKYVAVSILRNLLAVSLGAAAVMLTDTYKLEARVFTDVLAKSMFALAFFILLFRKGKCFFHKKYWKYALAFNIPLIPHYLSNFVLNQSDRLMIGKMVGEAQAAYYSVAYTISTVIMFIVTAINNSLTPYIYKKIHANQSGEIKKSINPIIIGVAALNILVMVFAPEIITIFAGENYREAIYVVPPVAASVFFIFLYSLFSTIEYYHQKTSRIAVATVAAAAVNIVLNYFGIKAFGYYAAGYTTLISYVILSVVHYIFYRMVIKEEGNERMFDEKCITVTSVVTLLITVLTALTYEYIFVRYSMLALVLVLAVVFRKKLTETLKSITKK